MQRFEFGSFDGTPIACYRWEAAGGDGALPPVVLQHGFAVDTAANWVATGVVEALTAAGRQVVGVDARGHGASGKSPDPARYGEARMALDLVALFDHLGADRVHLAGYSMGAIVALLTAAQDERVERLVVGGVGAGVVELGGVDTRVVPSTAIAAALRSDDPAGLPPETAAFRALADAFGADRASLAAQAEVVHAEPIALDRITAPTLVIAGGADPLADRPRVLADAIPGADLRLVPGDHLGAVADPLFTSSLLEFLNGGGGAAGAARPAGSATP